jgi:hypothetical protein
VACTAIYGIVMVSEDVDLIILALRKMSNGSLSIISYQIP